MNAGQWVQFSLTLILGLIAAGIALQQWRTNHHKLKLDLFDRRFQVYEATGALIQQIIRDVDVEPEFLHTFRRETAKAAFLFPDNLLNFLAELEGKARRLRQIDRSYGRMVAASMTPTPDFRPQSEREAERQAERQAKIEALTEEEAKIIDWIIEVDKNLRDRFRPYIDFRKI